MSYGTAQHAAAWARREAAILKRAQFSRSLYTALALLLDNGGGCPCAIGFIANPETGKIKGVLHDDECQFCHGTGIAPDTLAALQAAGYTKGENDG